MKRDMWENIKQANECVIDIPEEEERKRQKKHLKK